MKMHRVVDENKIVLESSSRPSSTVVEREGVLVCRWCLRLERIKRLGK